MATKPGRAEFFQSNNETKDADSENIRSGGTAGDFRVKEGLHLHLLFAARSIPSFGILGALKLLLAFRTRATMCATPKGFCGGFHMRGRTSDPLLAYNIFIRKEYPAPADPSISLIIDAGANVGYASIYFAQRYPKAKIIALEPEHSNYLQLKKNTAPYANVEALEMGLWYRQGRLKLSNPGAEKWAFIFTETSEAGILCASLPDLFKQYHSSGRILVKMDVEGAESAIFEKDPSWIPKVKYIFIEIHRDWRKIFNTLSTTNYEAWISGENVIIQREEPGGPA